MPITGGTLAEAAKNFCQHINYVLSRTVTQTPVVLVKVPGHQRFQITFRQSGQPIKARLSTQFGPMGLYLGYVCDSIVRRAQLHELRTLNYTYELYPDGGEEPIIRWEYVKNPESLDDLWCRHHLQGPIELQFNKFTVSLNDLHVPTGYVTFEEVLRFCVVDLGVRPLHENWDGILRESYDQFKTEFTQ